MEKEILSELPFIDAHIHLWDLRRLHYEWLSPPHTEAIARIAQPYGVCEYLKEAAEWAPVGAVHVEAGADADQALQETQWVDELAARHPLPNALVACAALDDPHVERLFASHAQYPRVRGIRHMVNWRKDPALSRTPRDITGDAAWARGFALLAKYDFSFDLQAFPEQLENVARVVREHPQTPVIIDHCGWGVDGDAAGVARWRKAMKQMAGLPNVFVKVSGLGISIEPWDRQRARDRARETIHLFGPERAMLASNLPTDRLFAPFNATMEALAEATADLSEDERRGVYAPNANRVYR